MVCSPHHGRGGQKNRPNTPIRYERFERIRGAIQGREIKKQKEKKKPEWYLARIGGGNDEQRWVKKWGFEILLGKQRAFQIQRRSQRSWQMKQPRVPIKLSTRWEKRGNKTF